MATVNFSEIDELLKGGKRGQDTLAQGGAPGSNPELPGYSQGVKATESAGFAGGPATGGQKFDSGPKARNPQAVIDANKGAPGLDVSAETAGKVREASRTLQDSANAFVKSQGAKSDEGVGSDVLGKLFAGGQDAADAAGAVRSRLAKDFQGDTFTPGSKEAWDAEAFVDPAKRGALRREQGNQKFAGQYSTGLQALDEAVERAEPKDYSGLLGDVQTYRANEKKAREDAQGAVDAAKGRFDTTTKTLKDTLSGKASGILSGLDTRLSEQGQADAAEAARLRSDAISSQMKALEATKRRLGEYRSAQNVALDEKTAKELDREASALEAQVKALEDSIGSGQYVTVDPPKRSRDELASTEERVAFNLINELLGSGAGLNTVSQGKVGVQTRDVTSDADKIRQGLDALFGRRDKSAADFAAALERNKVNAAAARATPNTFDPSAPPPLTPAEIPAPNRPNTMPAPTGPVEPGTAPVGPTERGPLTGKQPDQPKNVDLRGPGKKEEVSPVAKPIVKAGDFLAKTFGWG